MKSETEKRIDAGDIAEPEVLLLDAGSNNKVLNEILKLYAKKSPKSHVLLFSADHTAKKVLCLAQTPKVRKGGIFRFYKFVGIYIESKRMGQLDKSAYRRSRWWKRRPSSSFWKERRRAQ